MIAVFNQLGDCFFFKAAADIVPEFNGGLELFDIVVPDTDRKRVEKKLGIGLPCMAFGKCQIAVTERLGLSVDSAKICALTRPTSFAHISGSMTRYRLRLSFA